MGNGQELDPKPQFKLMQNCRTPHGYEMAILQLKFSNFVVMQIWSPCES